MTTVTFGRMDSERRAARAGRWLAATGCVALLGLVAGCGSGRAALPDVRTRGADDAPVEKSRRAPETLEATLLRGFASFRAVVSSGRVRAVSVKPILGPGSAEAGLGRFVATRLETWVRSQGAAVVDRGFLTVLQKELASRPGGAKGVTPAQLAGAYLTVDGLFTGTVSDLGSLVQVDLRLTSATSGQVIESSTFRLAKSPRVIALLGQKAVDATPLPQVVEPDLAVDYSLVVQNAEGTISPWEGQTLQTGSRIQLRLRPAQDCLLSVAAIYASGKLVRLFPPEDTAPGQTASAGKKAARVKVAAGQDIRLPVKEGDYWYPLVAPAGVETFAIVVERGEKRTAALQKALDDQRKAEETLAALKTRLEAPALPPAERTTLAERRQHLWELERMRRDAFSDDMRHSARSGLLAQRLRTAVTAVRAGTPLPADFRTRDLGAPVAGVPVTVKSDRGAVEVATRHAAGRGRLDIVFSIRHE